MVPKSINVFGTVYKIKRTKNFEHMGLCHRDTKLIEIDAALKGSELKQTYLHEVFHALMDELGITEIVDDQLEEIICESFSKMVLKIQETEIITKKKAAAAKKKKANKKRRGK